MSMVSAAATPNGTSSRPPPLHATFAPKNATPVKKLVIKGFKVKPKVPEDFEQVTWDKLNEAIHAIHSSRSVPYSLEELYRAAEGLCHHRRGESTYNRLRAACDEHIKMIKESLIEYNMETGDPGSGESWLRQLNDAWVTHCKQQIMIRSIFLYLDRTYVLQTSGVKSIWDMGVESFRLHIGDNVKVQEMTVAALLKQIEIERMGNIVSRDLLKSILGMFIDISIYTGTFELRFLSASEVFYNLEGDRLMAELSNSENAAPAVALYLLHVETRLNQETERCSTTSGYLGIGTRKSLISTVEVGLIKKHRTTLLEKGFDKLIEEKRVEDLRRMYILFSRVAALDELRAAFGVYILRSGRAVVIDPAQDANMVSNLLQFKDFIDSLISNAFHNNEDFIKTVKEKCEDFINQRQNKPAEMLAKHIDALLKTGKGVTENESEQILDKCLVLFRYIKGKDVFEAFYKNYLAKRLLLGRSASVDSEKSMLMKLKSECGAGFTSKLEGMFRDMELSRDFMTLFHQSEKNTLDLPSVDMNVNVLTAGFWPTYPPALLNLPEELSKCQEVFKQFYLSKYNGRTLKWQNSVGYCILRATFKKGIKELSVSLFQAVILLLFNQQDRLSYEAIKAAVGMEAKELDRTLQSLACGKVRVLNKIPKGREVQSTDSFEFNSAFENPLFRIKINSIQLKETVEEQKETTEKVFADRQYQVDAAIVRIMKARKKLSHALLIAELFDQLKFPIKPADLKKRIESLIDREYLGRESGDSSSYVYIA